ncbi:GNAT family N-acetyltransferase [Cyanobium sp. Morenito 9A2]|uniref:GNAT family N-acetyltransferase n=1 Tax=Cyanobium sp. Morenito 9A2 TaxID=2823718 RepID=UPI0020CF7F3C|nr:GNAT family N-acetyltransferase [Cyanobium sp. Morenito 9A2]MCP9848459.1 GNAT family N-acetyltransferase [Cyanobium sp. Morenito 9A2]
MAQLRPLEPDDLPQVIEVYRQAVIDQGPPVYSPRQVEVWAGLGTSAALLAELRAGFGLVSCSQGGTTIEAFAVLQPIDRLSLLYCRGRSSRQGRASALLAALEQHSHTMGVMRLSTEASKLSRPLLERRGWQVDHPEALLIAGVPFSRFRMSKALVGLEPRLPEPI